MGEINPRSGKQLGEWIKQHVGERALQQWPHTPTGQLRTDGDTLALYADLPILHPLLRHKAVTKLLSMYDKGLIKWRHGITDRLHPEFRLGGSRSGRVCAAKPNTQQAPRLPAFRELFTTSAGRVLIGADFNQIELRVAALLSQDTAMLDAYRNGIDLHRVTAAAVAGISPEQVTAEQRQAAKCVNFGNMFGQRAKGLAKTAKTDYERRYDRSRCTGNAEHVHYGLSHAAPLAAQPSSPGKAVSTGSVLD